MSIKKMKTGWKIGAVIGLAAIISLAAVGVSYAANGNPNPAGKSLCTFGWVESNDNGTTSGHDGYSQVDPGDNGGDPHQMQTVGVALPTRYPDVAATTASVISVYSPSDTISITLSNAYPGYSPTVFFGLSNQWPTPGIIQSINLQYSPEVTVKLRGVGVDQLINSGTEVVGALTIIANDNLQPGTTLSVTGSIIVTQFTAKGVLNVVTPSLPSGQVGWVYNQQLGAAMGNYPYAWSIVSGSLPPGLVLANPEFAIIPATNSVITGIPSTPGTSTFTVKVMDTTGDWATKTLSITIK
jgi:hypothetical protein